MNIPILIAHTHLGFVLSTCKWRYELPAATNLGMHGNDEQAAMDEFDKLDKVFVYALRALSPASIFVNFQRAVSNLKTNELIHLAIETTSNLYDDGDDGAHKPALLSKLLCDAGASNICSLHWIHSGNSDDVSAMADLIANECTALVSLTLQFDGMSEIDLFSDLLERPAVRLRLRIANMQPKFRGNTLRFFAALRNSNVQRLRATARVVGQERPLELDHFDLFFQFLEQNKLQALGVSIRDANNLAALLCVVANCTKLQHLAIVGCHLQQSINTSSSWCFALPRSITKLSLDNCMVGSEATQACWQFLLHSNITEFGMMDCESADGKLLGQVLLQCQGRISKLSFVRCKCAQEALAWICIALRSPGNKLRELELHRCDLNEQHIQDLFLSVQSPHCELRELTISDGYLSQNCVHAFLLPALRHPNCKLVNFIADCLHGQQMEGMVQREFAKTRKRQVIIALLVGQQLKSRGGGGAANIKRLPVEMLRLVGGMIC